MAPEIFGTHEQEPTPLAVRPRAFDFSTRPLKSVGDLVGGIELGADGSERIVELGTNRGHGGDNDHRDQRRDKAILNGGRAILIFAKTANASKGLHF